MSRTVIFCAEDLSARADKAQAYTLRELLRKNPLNKRMHKLVLSAAVSVAMMGVALAQEASNNMYLLDVDPARYAGPPGQRLMLRVGDQPRSITIGAQDEICVQLQRVGANSDVISARVRSLRPEAQMAEVRVVAPDISPGTYRSTPWGLLLRAVPEKAENSSLVKPLGTDTAPVCTL